MGANSALSRGTMYVQKHPFEGAHVGKSYLDHCLVGSATCSNQVSSCKMGYVLFIRNFSIKPLACIDELLWYTCFCLIILHNKWEN